ncbi:MAG: V-type ATP synthase subunit E [Actinomycetota bacterium]
MALDDMLRAIEEEGEARCKEILDNAEAEAAEILKNAKEEAKRVREEYVTRAEATMYGEKTRILSDAKLYVKKQVIQAKEKHIEDAFDNVASEFEAMRKRPEYASYFRRLLDETAANAEGNLVISVDRRDEKVARDAVAAAGLDCELRTDISTLGGLKAITADGRIVLTNTIDSRLERAKQFLKPEVATKLFG